MSTYILTGDITLLNEMKDELVGNGFYELTMPVKSNSIVIFNNEFGKALHYTSYDYESASKRIENLQQLTLIPSNYEGIKQKILKDGNS